MAGDGQEGQGRPGGRRARGWRLRSHPTGARGRTWRPGALPRRRQGPEARAATSLRIGTISFWMRASYGPRRPPSRRRGLGCSRRVGGSRRPIPSRGGRTNRLPGGSSARRAGASGVVADRSPRRDGRGVIRWRTTRAPGRVVGVQAAGSRRPHVLGEEPGDAVHQAQYVEFPTGQSAAESGVVTPPSSSRRKGTARGGRFEHANRFAWAAHPEDWPRGKAPAC